MAKRAVVVIECRNKEHAEAVLERVAKRYQAYITEKSTFLIDLFMGSAILFMCTVIGQLRRGDPCLQAWGGAPPCLIRASYRIYVQNQTSQRRMRKKLEFQHYVREALKDYMNEGLYLGEILESFYNPELTTAANRLYEEFEADIWDILGQRAMELGQADILATIPERSLLSMCDFRKHLFYTALIYELERIAKEEKVC